MPPTAVFDAFEPHFGPSLPAMRVLTLGSTGRVGGLVLQQLLQRGVAVRALVRSTLPEAEGLEVVEAKLLELSKEQLAMHLEGVDIVPRAKKSGF